jgi:hypothetical protein
MSKAISKYKVEIKEKADYEMKLQIKAAICENRNFTFLNTQEASSKRRSYRWSCLVNEVLKALKMAQ